MYVYFLGVLLLWSRGLLLALPVPPPPAVDSSSVRGDVKAGTLRYFIVLLVFFFSKLAS